jgi:replicative DNA helicase
MFVYRDEYYHEDSDDKGIAEVIIRKQRMGRAPQTIKMRWSGAYTHFADLTKGERVAS